MSHIVRRVLPHEYAKYRTHLQALDAESNRLRFGVLTPPGIIDKLCDGFDQAAANHILFCVENHQLEFVGIGHIVVGPDMELAFSVLQDHQGQGIGNALMARCIQYCRTHGILTGSMVCLSYNTTIKHLCIKHGIKLTTEHGETMAAIELPGPEFATYLGEGLDNNLAAIDYVTKRTMLSWTNKPG